MSASQSYAGEWEEVVAEVRIVRPDGSSYSAWRGAEIGRIYQVDHGCKMRIRWDLDGYVHIEHRPEMTRYMVVHHGSPEQYAKIMVQ